MPVKCSYSPLLDLEFDLMVNFAKLLRPHGFLALVQAAAELGDVPFFVWFLHSATINISNDESHKSAEGKKMNFHPRWNAFLTKPNRPVAGGALVPSSVGGGRLRANTN